MLAALLLNRVTLAPGEALYLPAGNLHAYLSGSGVELMANSDNVLRGGLTPKHVDVPELLRVLDFHAGPPPVLTGVPDGDWVRYDTPAEEFLLRRCAATSGRVAVPEGGARILLCTGGDAVVAAKGTELALSKGAAVWLAASDTGVTVEPRTPSTQLFLAGDGLSVSTQGSAMSTGGGTRAIVAALAANAGIAIAKFVGFVITGSSSMLAEAVHSLADTANQGLLLLGGKRAKRAATPEHPFGYGRDRFFYAFVVALLLFSARVGVRAVRGDREARPSRRADVAWSSRSSSCWWRSGWRASRSAPRSTSRAASRGSCPGGSSSARPPPRSCRSCCWRISARSSGWCSRCWAWGSRCSPTTRCSTRWAPIGIGILLGVIAIVLIVEMKSLLIGEGARPPVLAAIVGGLQGGAVQNVIHLRTQYLGPEELLVAAKIALTPGLPVEDVARAIDDAEARVRVAVPAARLIYLEPDLERTVTST